jgi:hypothetical protein
MASGNEETDDGVEGEDAVVGVSSSQATSTKTSCDGMYTDSEDPAHAHGTGGCCSMRKRPQRRCRFEVFDTDRVGISFVVAHDDRFSSQLAH